MLQPEELDRIAIVLVRARNPNNIGAVARAMHDFGFRDLRLVNDYSVPLEAARSAIDASAVLSGAREFPTVASAVADCTLVAGTTAVGERDLQHPLFALNEAAPKLLQALREPAGSSEEGPRAALIFGSEKTGLSNDELSHCHALLTIPMNTPSEDRHLSMNLGQAAAVCLYQLVTEPSPEAQPPLPSEETPATAADLTRIHSLFTEVLDESGYTRRHPANSREHAVRRLILRMRLSSADAPVWTGILRQLLHAIRPTK